MTDQSKSTAFRTSAVYWLITVGWILLTKFAIDCFVSDQHEITVFSAARVVLFASVSSVLLYYLIVRLTYRFMKESTGHARADEALRRSELHLKTAQALARIGSWEWNRIERMMSWSDEMFEIFRMSPDDFTGDPGFIEELIYPDDMVIYRQIIEPFFQRGQPLPRPLEFRILTPDGEVRRLISLSSDPQTDADDEDRVTGVVQDITEMRRQEEALRESEARLKEAERLAHLGSETLDLGTDTTTWSDEMYRITGRDPMLPPPKFSERAGMYTGYSWNRFSSAMKSVIESGEPYHLELEIARPDGSVRQVHARGAADRNSSGDVIRIIGTMQDITDRKNLEETLQLQASALKSAGNAIVITNGSGAATYVNTAFTKLTGYTPDEVKGRTMKLLNSGVQNESFYRDLWDTITSGLVWRGNLVNRRKDGTLYHEQETITPVKSTDEEVHHFIAIKEDVTERIRAEESLRLYMTQLQELSERLEKVREEERKSLSHEVHDELGQILTAVKMRLLSIDKPGPIPAENAATNIGAAVFLIDQAMKSVRDIAGRLRPGVLDYLGLIPAIEWQIEQFQKNSGIRCRLEKPSEEPVFDDEKSTALFRILQEALTNVARHARATSVSIVLSEQEREFVMSVTDDGIGIRQQDVDNPRSFGLLGIRERLRPFYGSCTFRRPEAGGTELVINLPNQTN